MTDVKPLMTHEEFLDMMNTAFAVFCRERAESDTVPADPERQAFQAGFVAGTNWLSKLVIATHKGER